MIQDPADETHGQSASTDYGHTAPELLPEAVHLNPNMVGRIPKAGFHGCQFLVQNRHGTMSGTGKLVERHGKLFARFTQSGSLHTNRVREPGQPGLLNLLPKVFADFGGDRVGADPLRDLFRQL